MTKGEFKKQNHSDTRHSKAGGHFERHHNITGNMGESQTQLFASELSVNKQQRHLPDPV